MKPMNRHPLIEASRFCGVTVEVLTRFIEYRWIQPAEAQDSLLDEEDLARARLIQELQENFGVNDEAVPIILQLIDQLHCLQWELKRIR